jgi:hypothetical protein
MGGAQQILARLVAPIGHWNFFALFAYFAVKSFNRKSLKVAKDSAKVAKKGDCQGPSGKSALQEYVLHAESFNARRAHMSAALHSGRGTEENQSHC